MKQAENLKSKYYSQPTWQYKYQPDIRDPLDPYCKYVQKNSQSVPPSRSCRSPTAEPVASYYSSTNTYKLHKNHSCSNPTHSKYNPPQNIETAHQPPQHHPRQSRHYSPNVAVVRKIRYDEDVENNEKQKYIGEELEFTEDNAEEDVDDEVEDDHEEAGVFLDKDYEEQEADDEIDEESDTSPQTRRVQRGDKKEALLRTQQQWRVIEQQQNPRRLRYQQHMPLDQDHSSPPRYYQSVTEHDIPEPLSSSRRSPADYDQWAQSRSSTDRYEPATMPMQSNRRARTKPEMDHLIDPEYNKTRKCSRCGVLSNKRSPPLNRNVCRFDDRLNFPMKGPIGDESEIREQTCCGRCNVRHNMEDANVANEMSAPGLYPTKPRRPRDVKSPIYQIPEQRQMIDKITEDYARLHTRDTQNAFPEKMKRSVHTSHGPPRTSRYQ